MANWCWNCIAIFRRDADDAASKRQIQELYMKIKSFETPYSVIKDARDEDGKEFPADWYGNLLLMCGEDKKDIACRGCIQGVDWIKDGVDDGGWIKLQTETAWGPQEDIIDKMIEHYPSLDYVYIAEEPNMEIYINTDYSGRFFVDRYKIDFDFSDLEDGYCDTEYYESERKFMESVIELAKKFQESVKKAHLTEFVYKLDGTKSDEEIGFEIARQIQEYMSDHDSREEFANSYFCVHKFDY